VGVSCVEIRLAPAGIDQPQRHVDAHHLDLIDGGQQCGQAVRNMRADERAARSSSTPIHPFPFLPFL
jgi:hypothetical protein